MTIENDNLDLFAELDGDISSTSANPPAPPAPPGQITILTVGDDGLETMAVDEAMQSFYLDYSMSVVMGRALPSLQDGLKPVHRRALFAMSELGNEWNKPYKKSARIVGDVIGKYHPHGDTAVYDTLVRMAQDFSMRYPLVDGQGNFGSIDGDNAAAMRYTEIRMTKFSTVLMDELEMGTVVFSPNYDGSLKEPSLLPSRLPMILINGSSGIAVGMACEVPSHNLNEVVEAAIATIRKPNITLEQVLEHIKGPDFPFGGQIISPLADIERAYRSGQGSLRMRARWTVEKMAHGHWQIAVTELPHGVAPKKVFEELGEGLYPKIKKGEKALSAKQLATRQLLSSVIGDMRNESTRNEPVRLVFEPKSIRQNPDELMAILLANSSMESNVSINMTLLDINNRPGRMALVDILKQWSQSRFDTVTNRTQFQLDKANARIHILEGRMIAFLRIEEIINVIRLAEDPKKELMSAFALTETQATDILEIRLRQLARLAGIEIERELTQLKDERDEYMLLLSDETAMKNLIIKELRADAKAFGDERRTLLQPAERTTAAAVPSVVDEPVTVLVSKNGWVRTRQGHGLDLASVQWKDGDGFQSAIETRTVSTLSVMDTKGRVYAVAVANIPGGKGDGAPLAAMIDLQNGGKVAHVLCGSAEDKYLFAGSEGYGFIAPLSSLQTKQRAGKDFMTVSDGEKILPPLPLKGEPFVEAISSEARLLLFPIDEVKERPSGGKGVTLMDVGDGKLQELRLGDGETVQVQSKRGKAVTLRGEPLAKYKLHRARKGCAL